MPVRDPQTTPWQQFSTPRKRWQIECVPNGLSGRGDLAVEAARKLLDDGWEPFAVSDGRIWLRRCFDV